MLLQTRQKLEGVIGGASLSVAGHVDYLIQVSILSSSYAAVRKCDRNSYSKNLVWGRIKHRNRLSVRDITCFKWFILSIDQCIK